jgi:hypothetical protein
VLVSQEAKRRSLLACGSGKFTRLAFSEPETIFFSHCMFDFFLSSKTIGSLLLLFSVYSFSRLEAFGQLPRTNVHRLMIPPPPYILGCRIFQAHDVFKLCRLVLLFFVTGHCSNLQTAGVEKQVAACGWWYMIP